jgi:hypothetical protein
MKKNLLLTCSLGLLLCSLSARAQSPGVTIGALTAADASAALDIVSSSKGALLPRITQTARLAMGSGGIPAPAPGLLVYQTDGTPGFYYNAGTAASPSWQQVATAAGAAVTTSNGLTKTGANITLGGSLSGATTIGLGTSNLLLTSSGGKVGIGTSSPLSALSLSQVLSQSNTANQTIGELSFVGFNRPLASASILAQSPNWDDVSHLIFKTSPGASGATERLRITADGNVGIGTSSPASLLDVRTTDNSAAITVGRTDATAGALYLGNSGHGVMRNYATTNDVGLYTTNANIYLSASGAGNTGQFALLNGGNVGIGVPVPAQKLDVAGNIAASGSLGVLLNSQDRPLITRGWDAFTSGNYSGAGRWGLFMESGALIMGVPAIASRNFQWATYNANSTVAAQLMTLTQTGNLGLGTTTPDQQMEVSGATAPTSAGTAPQLRLSRPGTFNVKYDNVFDVAVGSYGTGSGSQTRVDFQLSSLTTTTDATPLSLLANGTVGINTTTPATTLDVRTTDNSAAITVGSTGGGVGALYLGNSGHGLKRNYSASNDVGLYTTAANLYLSASGTSTSQFSLLNNGNVGIGTGTPGNKLEVNGTTLINANYDLLLRDANVGLGWYGGSKVFTAVSGFDGPVLYGYGAGMLGTKDGGNRTALFWNSTGQIGIGTTTPASSALLDVSSTSKGFLPPRMSQTQRDAVASPAEGLTVYNTSTDRLNLWNGTAWTEVITGTTAAPAAAVTYSYTGGVQTYTVPAGMTQLKVTAVGAAGGLNSGNGFAGGQGGSVTATIAVTPGETLTIYVGGKGGDSFSGSVGAAAGYNGGGQGFARFSTGGGGGTDIRRGTSLADRLVVGGGGGGSGTNSRAGAGGNPGNAGNSFNGGGGGQGGTQGGGGAGGTGSWNGSPGSLGQGGNAGFTGPSSSDNGTGAGGGGYYGGGGGGLGPGGTGNGGGGGGSSWAASSASDVSYQTGGNTGHGSVTLVASALPAPAFDGANIVNVGPWTEAGDNVYRAGGKVGIGTTSPQQTLDVSGGSLVVGAGDLIKVQGAHLQWNRFVGGGETFLLNQQGGGPGGIIFGKSDAVSSGNNNITEWGRFDQNGNFGIGTNNPGQKLTVIGNICASGGVNCASDGRFKKDVTLVQGALASIMKLRGVTYYWKQAEFPDKQFPARRQLGFIAQEIEPYYPEMVTTDADGYKSVDYSRLTPVLVEALKEQQQQIEALKQEVKSAKAQAAEATAATEAFEVRLRRLEAGQGQARK